MKYLFFFFFSVTIYAQNMVSGNIISENGYVIQNVIIINISSGAKTSDNGEGFFKIKANTNDELRFVKENFERRSIIIQSKNFLTPLSVQLIAVPTEVEEVKIGVKLTGDLEKDSKKFNPSYKVVALNKDIREYVKKPLTEVRPKNNIPSTFAPPDFSTGQVNLLGIIGLIFKPKEYLNSKNRNFSFSEIDYFHKRIKENIDKSYFLKQGLDEYELQSYILYADEKLKLINRYYKKFNKEEIEKSLRDLLPEYLNEKIYSSNRK